MTKMRIFITLISVLVSFFSFSVEQDILKGKFKSLQNFDNMLPEHSDTYLLPTFKSTLFGCTSKCLRFQLCEGFLFNSISKNCWLLRCSLHGLKTISSESGWRYFNIINSCDFGWSLYNDHCYLYNESMVDWMEAMQHCESLGGYLLEIQDQEENEWITRKMLEADICSVKSACSTWSGGIIRASTEYVWSHSGNYPSYTNWKPNQPSHYHPCINLRPSGRWNDAFCKDPFKFICEKSLQM